MLIVPYNEIQNRQNKRTGQAVRPSRSVQKKYRNALYDITRLLGQHTQELISLQAQQNQFTQQAFLLRLQELIQSSEQQIAGEAERIAQQFVDDANIQNKNRFENMLKQSLNVSTLISGVGATEANLNLALQSTKLTNVGLIKSIGSEHWSKILIAVNQAAAGTLGEPLTTRLKKIGGITTRRAKLIARDQTAKATSQMNQARMMDSGIKSYTWRTSEDERVVGNPSGLYPKGSRAHRNHYARNGKEFYWDQPPSDGHPGEPIQCRCIAIPIIDKNELNLQVM